MPDWQERITQETRPAIRAEHNLRYTLAAPLIAAGAVWCDLGCGNGIAAADALGDTFAGRALLVDLDEAVAQTAADRVHAGETSAIAADLARPEDVARVREALLAHDAQGERVVTCFEVVEHLEAFAPLVEALVQLATEDGVTVLLSVPNDEFWGLENPHHRTIWGAGAFAELRRLLPADHVLLRQLALSGSRIVREGDEQRPAGEIAVPVATDGVPTHFLAAFGPRAADVAGTAIVVQTDLDEQRRWERQRECDLAYFQSEADELREFARTQIAQYEEWRTYIHELEGRLGIPPSGGGEQPRMELPASDRGQGAGA
jgi:SAM-dependent methyltransferase